MVYGFCDDSLIQQTNVKGTLSTVGFDDPV